MQNKASVEVWLYNSKIASLLILQVDNFDYTFWQPITGGIEKGETALAAAIREVNEETSIQLAPEKLISLGHQEVLVEAGQLLIQKEVFLGITEETSVVIAAAEHQAYRWLPWQSAIEKQLCWPNNQASLQLAKKYISSFLKNQ
ncbi:NUDIX hydrolase [Enterococcus sp. LJL120]